MRALVLALAVSGCASLAVPPGDPGVSDLALRQDWATACELAATAAVEVQIAIANGRLNEQQRQTAEVLRADLERRCDPSTTPSRASVLLTGSNAARLAVLATK